MHIKTLFKENDSGSYRAEIYSLNDFDYRVDYYGPTGPLRSEEFKRSSVLYVESMATQWINSIKVLNE